MSELRQQLLATLSKPKVHKLDLNEFGYDLVVYVKALNVGEAIRYIEDCQLEEDANGKLQDPPKEYFAKLAATFLCDAEGNRLYDLENAADIKELTCFNMPVIRHIYQSGQQLSRNNHVDDDVEEAKKNSNQTTS